MPRTPIFKSPIMARTLIVSGLSLLVMATSASAQERGLSAEQAVALALSSPHFDAVAQAKQAQLKAALNAQLVRPVPQLSLTHEQVFGDANVAQLQLTAQAQYQLDLSDWRAKTAQALPHEQRAVAAQQQQWRLEVERQVLYAFYKVRYHQARGALVATRLAYVEGALALMAARAQGGDVATLEVKRLEREVAVVKAAQTTERAAELEAWATLEAWIGASSSSTALSGELAPPAPDLQPSKPTSPALKALEHTASAQTLKAQAYGQPFWRGWEVGGGYRIAQMGASLGHGFVLSLAAPLPLWNIDAARQDELMAQAQQAQAEVRLGQDLAQRAELAAIARYKALAQTLAQLPSAQEDDALTKLGERAFSAGELSLVELLDLYQSQAELSLARVELQWGLRQAALDLQYRRGQGAK